MARAPRSGVRRRASANIRTRSCASSATRSPTLQPSTPVDYGAFEALTFDCYGTLIDWEAGLTAAFRPILAAHGIEADAEDILERYARHESQLEAGPYVRYRAILAESARGVLAELGARTTQAQEDVFGGSVADWPPFPDSAAALARLKSRYRLGVITNCDDDLFAASNRRLGVEFDW